MKCLRKTKMLLKPFFEVDVHLDADNCQLKPTLEKVKSAKNIKMTTFR